MRITIAIFTMLFAALFLVAQAAPETTSAPAPPPARLVNLFIQDEPIQGALDLLSNQVHIHFSIAGSDRLKHISIDARQKPLWETVHQLVAQIGRSQPASWEMADPSDDMPQHVSGRICTSGPYLIIAEAITHEADYLRPDGDVERVLLNVRLMTDPSLQLLYAAAESRPATAVDEKGQSLVPVRPLSEEVVSVNGDSLRFAPAVQVVMERPLTTSVRGGDLGHTLKVVEGEIEAASPMFESVEVPVGGASSRIYDSISARFVCSAPPAAETAGSGGLSVHAEFTRPLAMPSEDWNRWQKQLAATRISVFDAKGRAWYFPAPACSANSTLCGLTFDFSQRTPGGAPGAAPAGEAAKIIVNVPIKAEPLRIPYRFENLPLP